MGSWSDSLGLRVVARETNSLLSNTHLYKITFPYMYKNSKGAKGFFEYFDMSLTLAYTLT